MRWMDWMLQRTGMVIGAIIGLVLGIVFLFAGFWKMIGFAMIVLFGMICGVLWDRHVFAKIIEWFHWRKRRRRF